MIPLWLQCVIVFGPPVVWGVTLSIAFWKIDHTDWYPGSGRFD